MRLIKPSFEIIEQEQGLDGIYKIIEKSGRTCYKSEDKITEGSAKKFVDMMIKNGHYAMLEHGTVYLSFKLGDSRVSELYTRYKRNKYSIIKYKDLDSYYITTNLRVLVENDWLEDLKYLCEPTEYHEKRVTVKFICDRGVSHEFVRHRVFSFAQESTRYCNYFKDKFGNELTYIIPSWIDDIPNDTILKDSIDVNSFVWKTTNIGKEVVVSKFTQVFLYECCHIETSYEGLINRGYKPQQVRQILPNALKTELVMTGFVSDWKHFFDLRDATSAHPDAIYLVHPLHKEFIKRNFLK